MTLFQNPGVVEEAVRRTFEISPDTIYGVLLGILLIAGGIGWWLYIKQNKQIREILKETVSVEKSLLNAIENQTKEFKDVKDDIINHINNISGWLQRNQ